VADRAASIYVHTLAQGVRAIAGTYELPREALRRRLEDIPVIVPSAPSGARVSLAQILETENLTKTAAYTRLREELRGREGGSGLSSEQLDPIARAVGDRLAGKVAARGGAAVAAIAGGPVGIFVSAGIFAWGVVEHEQERPDLEARLREQVVAALEEMWQALVEDPNGGVLAAVHHMSTHVEEGRLRGEAQDPPSLQELF
jgi:hypothetical protein